MARFLALDWDQNQLHLISATTRGSTVSVQRAIVWQEAQPINPATAEELGKILRERLRAAGIAPAPVLACLGRDRVIVKEIRYPSVPETEEPAIVRFQAAKELTDPIEEVIIDYVITGGQEGGERRAAALVIRREMLEAYQKFCQAAGLKLAALTPRLLGAAACLRKVIGTTVVTPPPEPAEGVIAIVVVGEKTAEMTVLRGGKSSAFLLARSVTAGNNLAAEVRRNLSVHAGQQPQQPVRAVYVTGKGSGELRERLSELVEVPVHTFDPLTNSETLDLPVGQRGGFAGPMGLLFSRAEGELPANFVSPRQPKPVQKLNFRTIRLALVASLALVVGLVVLGRVLHASWEDEVIRLKQDNENLTNELLLTGLNAKRLKAVDDWDNVVPLDEMYDLTWRIQKDLNDIRIKGFQVERLPRALGSRYVAKVTLKGELRNCRNLRGPLDGKNGLVSKFTKDGYYSPEAPRVEGNQFTLVVNVERRALDDFKHIIADVTEAEALAAAAAAEAEAARAARAKGSLLLPGTGTGKGGVTGKGGFIGGTGGAGKKKGRTKN